MGANESAYEGQLASVEEQYRTLRFAVPPGQYLGWLEAVGRPWNDPHRYDVTSYVNVPEHEELTLHVERETSASLSALALLDSDALIGVVLAGAPVGDVALSSIWRLRALQHLDLSRTLVTGGGLLSLRQLRALRSLNLQETAVTDAGLENLAELTDLQTLDLSKTNVRGFCLRFLARCDELCRLLLDGSWVDADGLQHLPSLPALRDLRLAYSNISYGALRAIQGLCSLSSALGL